MTTIQFSGVKKNTNRTEFREYFEKLGTVKMVQLMKGKGIVTFALPEEASEAMEVKVHYVCDSQLRALCPT